MARTLIASGLTATLYKEGEWAYKVFSPTFPKEWIEYEVHVHMVVKTHTQLPIPSMSLQGHHEIKMDYLEGITLTDKLLKQKYKSGAEDLVQIQKKIYQYHDLPLSNMHDVYEALINKSDFSNELKEKALQSLHSIPRGTTLIHLDCHPDNIMDVKGTYYILDWTNALLGNPLFDIARTYILLNYVAYRFSRKYLSVVEKELHFKKEDIYKAIPLMALIHLIQIKSKDQRQIDFYTKMILGGSEED